jgi:hypothetical protein
MSFIRRGIATILLIIAALLLLVAGASKTLYSLVGTPERTAQTALSIISSPDGSRQFASIALDKIKRGADSPTATLISAKEPALINALAAVVRDPSTQDIITNDYVTWYHATTNGTAVSIDVSPVMNRFMAALHSVDPAIPSHIDGVSDPIVVEAGSPSPLKNVEKLGTSSLIVMLIGIAMALLTSIFLVRGSLRRLLSLGLSLALPAVLLASTATQIRSKMRTSNGDPHQQSLVLLIVDRVGSALTSTALLILVIDVALLLAVAAVQYRPWTHWSTPSAAYVTPENTNAPESPTSGDSGAL